MENVTKTTNLKAKYPTSRLILEKIPCGDGCLENQQEIAELKLIISAMQEEIRRIKEMIYENTKLGG